MKQEFIAVSCVDISFPATSEKFDHNTVRPTRIVRYVLVYIDV